MEYPLSPIKKMLKRSHMRVSEDAVKEFGNLLEEITADLAAEAASIARSRGKKTVSLEDVRLAEKKMGI